MSRKKSRKPVARRAKRILRSARPRAAIRRPSASSLKAQPSRLSKQARYARRQQSEAADIGELRPVRDPARKERCRRNLELFLTEYFPHSTGLKAFSPDHRRVIARIEKCTLAGGREAKAVYRGFAKTTISENASIWALAYGHRRFVALFGANATAAKGNIESIKAELETNDRLDDDFPEITQAIRALEGKPQRAASQTCQGELTHLEWTGHKIALPAIAGSLAAGGVITAHGLTAGVRGLKHKRPDGRQQRPDLAIIDDPQTDASAASPVQIEKRLGLIRKVILRLAGHDKAIACFVNGTIIQRDDVMDQLTDPKRNPAFQAERIPMLRRFSDAHETLWLGDYARFRTSYDPEDPADQARAHAAANDFYKKHRPEMDRGAQVSWEHCFDPECELSAIQHAYNILVDDGLEAFMSECQGDPLGSLEEEHAPNLRGLSSKLNRLERGKVPIWCSKLTAFIDVQGNALYWLAVAFKDDFTGAIVDWGTEPEQGRNYFTLREIRKTLRSELEAAHPGQADQSKGFEPAIWFGLSRLEKRLAERAWPREEGGAARLDKVLIDSGWGDSTDTVYEYCRRSAYANLVMPSKGVGIRAGDKPMTEWQIKPHEKPGFHFVETTDPAKRAVKLFKYDANWWKTFVAHRAQAQGPGALTLFGERPDAHRMLEDHCQAEFATKTEGRGRTVWEWRQRPNEDNHLFDCLVGCHAAAALLGCRLGENRSAPPPRRKPKVSYF